MRNSLDTYERLLAAAKQYRNAMLALASATSNFASALEDCARQKGATHPPARSAATTATGGAPLSAASSLASSLVLDSSDDARSSTSGSRLGHDDSGELSNALDGEGDLHADSAPGERLMAASGLHHMMSNQQQLLVSGSGRVQTNELVSSCDCASG